MVVSVKSRKKWLSTQAKILTEQTGLENPEAAMRKLVIALLEEAEQTKAPINLSQVASFRGINKIRVGPIQCPAIIVPVGNGLEILVNSSDNAGRRNFSIAHEICHTFFNDDITSSAHGIIGCFSIQSEEEYLCDIGAATLLLPPHLVSAYTISHACSLDSIICLAQEFETSLEAAGIAWIDSSSLASAVIFCEEKLKPIQLRKKDQLTFPGMEDILPRPELRIIHACTSPNFPFFLPKNKSVSRYGPIYRSMAETRTSGNEKLKFDGEQKVVHSESIFTPYEKDGKRVNKVMSLILPIMSK